MISCQGSSTGLFLKICSLSCPQSVCAIEAVIEFGVQMTCLKAQHSAIRRRIGGETSITIPDIGAVSCRRPNRGLANGGDLSRDFGMMGPRASSPATEHPVRAEFDIGHRTHGIGHGLVIRRAEWLEQDLAV